MSTEDNKALVRRFFEEVFNEKRVDLADEFVAPDYLARCLLRDNYLCERRQ